MDDDLGVGGRLEQPAAADQLATQLMALVRLPLWAEREAAELEIGEQRLDVAQDRLAGGRIAHMADRRMALAARLDHLLGAEIVADLAQAAMGVELLAVEGDDAGGLLAAMLQGVQAERRLRRRLLDRR